MEKRGKGGTTRLQQVRIVYEQISGHPSVARGKIGSKPIFYQADAEPVTQLLPVLYDRDDLAAKILSGEPHPLIKRIKPQS